MHTTWTPNNRSTRAASDFNFKICLKISFELRPKEGLDGFGTTAFVDKQPFVVRRDFDCASFVDEIGMDRSSDNAVIE